MRAAVKAEWKALKGSRPGKRFTDFYERHREHARPWTRPLLLVLAVAAFAVGIVLVFIPGPAILFFGITAALVATQSRGVARQFDRAELAGRRWLRAYRAKRRRQRHA